MEKLNYEIVGKKATIECLISGEIKQEDLNSFVFINVVDGEVNVLGEISTEELFDSINNPNILFLQNVS